MEKFGNSEKKVVGWVDYMDDLDGIYCDFDNKYNTIPDNELASEKSRAEVNSHGAYVYELASNGENIFFPRDNYKNEAGEKKVRGGCHLCFPNFGPASEEYNLPQHGPARTMDWNTNLRSLNSIELQRTINDVSANLVYTVEDNSFAADLFVINEEFEDKPLAPGFHPYFNVGQNTEVKINGQVFDLEKDAEELKNTVYMDGVETLEIGERTINFENKNLDHFAIWSGGETDKEGNRYICVEPTAEGPTFSEGQNPSTLKGGQKKSYQFKISW